MVKRTSMIAFGVICLTMIITCLMQPIYLLMTWLNTLFMTSLIIIVMSGAVIVWAGRFFHHFIYDIVYFLKRLSRTSEVVVTVEGRKVYHGRKSVRPKKVKIAQELILASIVTSLLATILSYVLFA